MPVDGVDRVGPGPTGRASRSAGTARPRQRRCPRPRCPATTPAARPARSRARRTAPWTSGPTTWVSSSTGTVPALSRRSDGDRRARLLAAARRLDQVQGVAAVGPRRDRPQPPRRHGSGEQLVAVDDAARPDLLVEPVGDPDLEPVRARRRGWTAASSAVRVPLSGLLRGRQQRQRLRRARTTVPTRPRSPCPTTRCPRGAARRVPAAPPAPATDRLTTPTLPASARRPAAVRASSAGSTLSSAAWMWQAGSSTPISRISASGCAVASALHSGMAPPWPASTRSRPYAARMPAASAAYPRPARCPPRTAGPASSARR